MRQNGRLQLKTCFPWWSTTVQRFARIGFMRVGPTPVEHEITVRISVMVRLRNQSSAIAESQHSP